MIKFLFSYLSSFFGQVKKIMIVVITCLAVIYLFMFFLQKDRIPLQNDRLIQENRNQIYNTINQHKDSKSQGTQISLVIYRAMVCRIMGEACTDNPEDGDKNFENSLIAGMGDLIAMPYSHPPASSMVWVQNGLQNAGFIPQAYAAEGIGFSSIKGYMTIWKLFRDLAFMLLVLFMVILGFLIMFRVKLDGQAAVAIETILPRIVVTMLLITFSFAIVGLLIDLMYTVILIGTSILFKLEPLQQSLTPEQIDAAQKSYLVARGDMLWPDSVARWPFTGKSVFAVGSALYDVLPTTFKVVTQSVLSITIGLGLTQLLTSWFQKYGITPFHGFGLQGLSFGVTFGKISNWLLFPVEIAVFIALSFFVPGIVLGVIILLTILLFMFRLFFMLLSSYLKLIIYLIFAPFVILFNVFPGNNSFMWWLKNIMGELSVFPTVILISLTGQAIVNLNVGNNSDFRLPFLYGIDAHSFNFLVATGIVLLTPDFIKIVKKTIGAEDAPFSFGIGTFLSGASVFTGAMGVGQNIMGLKSTLVGHDPHKGSKGLLDIIGLKGVSAGIKKVTEMP